MKKLQVILCSAAMVGLCSLAQAQDPDSASNNMNNPAATEQSNDNTQSDDQKTEEAENAEQAQENAPSTDQQLQNDANAMKENFEGATIDKVGPNGEELFMERGKYFYYDAEGKKVKVKKSDVRDKSQSAQPQ